MSHVTYRCDWCNGRFMPDTVVHRFCSVECRTEGQKRDRMLWRQREIAEDIQRVISRREVELLCLAINFYCRQNNNNKEVS